MTPFTKPQKGCKPFEEGRHIRRRNHRRHGELRHRILRFHGTAGGTRDTRGRGRGGEAPAPNIPMRLTGGEKRLPLSLILTPPLQCPLVFKGTKDQLGAPRRTLPTPAVYLTHTTTTQNTYGMWIILNASKDSPAASRGTDSPGRRRRTTPRRVRRRSTSRGG